MRKSRFRASLATVGVVVILAATLTACSWVSGLFGDDDGVKSEDVGVFDIQVGDCFLAPPEVNIELADLNRVDCADPHHQEMYAVVTYDNAPAEYPGNAELDRFANGACAEQFGVYVGIAYPDSSLWMTYLLPSPRSWQQAKDRSVLCFVTTTGSELTSSVKGSKQ